MNVMVYLKHGTEEKERKEERKMQVRYSYPNQTMVSPVQRIPNVNDVTDTSQYAENPREMNMSQTQATTTYNNEMCATPYTNSAYRVNVSPIQNIASVQDVMNAAQYVGNQLKMNTNSMNETIQSLARYAEALEKKNRKKRVGQKLALIENKQFVLVEIFDNGAQNAKNVFLNLLGPVKVALLHITSQSPFPKFFIISFEESQIEIVGEIARMSPRYIYDSFIKMGVAFNLEIPVNKLREILFQYFAPMVEQCSKVVLNTGQTGWQDQWFIDQNEFFLCHFKEMRPLPVMKREFQKIRELQHADINMYFKCINKIENDHLIFLLYPFLCITSSIFECEGHDIPFAINFLCDKCEQAEMLITSFFQIYNRHALSAFYLHGMKEKELEKILLEIRDDVLILDFQIIDESPYERKKQGNLVKLALNSLINHKSTKGNNRSKISAGLVLISDVYLKSDKIKNISLELDESLMKTLWTLQENKVVEKILTSYISFVEKHFEEIKTLIKKGKSTMQGIYNIVEWFWEDHGLRNFRIHFPYDESAFELVIDDEIHIAQFIDVTRKAVSNCYFVQKQSANRYADPTCVIYDDQFVWFPSNWMNEIIARSGLKFQKNKIFSFLKEKKSLVADQSGFTRKLQIAGIRGEYYQFQKELFDSVGKIKIENLGRERD